MTRERSMNPNAVKSRLRNASKKGEQAHKDLAVVYQKPIEEWDFEELQRGRPRNAQGTFSGGRPKWISPIIMEEARKRLRSMGQVELGRHTSSAIRVMVQLMEDYETIDLVRFQAAKYVLDQILGMPVNKVEVEGSINIRQFLADVMENPDGTRSDDDDIVDAEVVEEDDDDDDE